MLEKGGFALVLKDLPVYDRAIHIGPVIKGIAIQDDDIGKIIPIGYFL